MNWQDVETWEEAAKAVADLIKKNEFLEWYVECTNKENLEQVRELMEMNKEVEQQLETYRQELTERSAQLVRAIRLLQEEGINFEMEEARAKAHASGDLAELLKENTRKFVVDMTSQEVWDELNQKENDDER
jgi:hypothetical protein